MQFQSSLYSVYRYLIIGPEEVGKTNLITRFIKDEFIEARNLKLEGEQSVLLLINNCKFKISFRDDLNSNSAGILNNPDVMNGVDGIVFLFSLENQETFACTELNINKFINEIQPAATSQGKKLSSILVGNKADLLSSNVDLQVLMEKEKRGDKKSISDQARYYDQQKGIKFFEISTKCSTKQEIEALFVELVHQNEVLKFVKIQKSEGGKNWWSKYVPPMPCNEQSACAIF